MSIWSDMSIIVSATLSGDITFKTVQAYRSEAAWFVFGPLTILGAIAFYYRERCAERLERSTLSFQVFCCLGCVPRFCHRLTLFWAR